MNDNQDMIRIAVHTPAMAARVVRVLENHGIKTLVTPVAKSTATDAAAVSVPSDDLVRALRIVESGNFESAAEEIVKEAGMSGHVLIPVDFSDLGFLAVKVGFDMARRLGVKAVVLNAYPDPMLPTTPTSAPFPDDFTSMEEFQEMEESEAFDNAAEKHMVDFKLKVRDLQDKGKLAQVGFTTLVRPGVPEDVIRDYTRATAPLLVVMSTHGSQHRRESLLGSVTAEVLDNCRVPVFTVPENFRFESVEKIRKLVFLCNLDRQDVISVEFLMSMFDYPDVEVVLVPVVGSDDSRALDRLETFQHYLTSNYPDATFTVFAPAQKEFDVRFREFLNAAGIQLLIVPNKKKNIFVRLFNPGIPHRILFERDIPMLALPV